MTDTSDSSTTRKVTLFGITGLVIALVALAAAVLSPWAVDVLEPEAKPIDEVAIDAAMRIKDRVAAKLKGEEFIPPPEEKRFEWAKWYPASTVACGAVAICFGVVGFVRRDDVRFNGATVAVGLSAIVFQYFLLIAAALILLLLIGLVLSALGVSP